MVKTGSKKAPKSAAASGTGRVRKLNKKQQRARAKKQAQKQTPLPGSFRLTRQVFVTLKNFWKPLGGIFLVYLLLNAFFAVGIISGLYSAVGKFDASHHRFSVFNNFGSLLISGATGSSQSSSVETILLVLESLVIIWAIRRLMAGETVRVKQAYYQSMFPLTAFLLVIFVIILQLLPISVGAVSLALILSLGLTGNLLLIIGFSLLFALLAIWSIRMVSSSIFAIYIVTLPDMQPRQALRAAKNLVRYRRLKILRRLFFLPLCLLVLMGIIILPLIWVASFSVAIAFFVLSMLAVLFVHTYLYSLYRGLIA